MDAIIDYLPSPDERPPTEAIKENNEIVTLTPDPKAKLCILAFKVSLNQTQHICFCFSILQSLLNPLLTFLSL
jgi:translation elongation factor EF-G